MMSTPRHSRARQRRIYRRRRFIAALLLVGVLAAAAFGVYAGMLLNGPIPATAATLTPITVTEPVEAQLVWPSNGAGAIAEVGRPGLLGIHGETGSVPIASITKVITALVVLDEKPLAADEAGPTLTFTDADVDIYYDAIAENGSVAPVADGLELTERQTLEAMLIESANNYSVSLVNWAFGSMDAYLKAAATWLEKHGLNATSVADSSGISPDSISSTADLVKLGELALANPTVAAITATSETDLPYIGTIENTNKLIGTDGVTGLKTGTTDEAGACLLFSAEFTISGTVITVVGVMLGGDTHPQLNEDILALLDSTKAGYQEVTLATAGERVGEFTTAWGQTSTLVAASGASVLVYSAEKVTQTITVDPIQTVQAGQTVGELAFTVGDRSFTVPVEATEEITGPDDAWRWANRDAILG